MVRSVRSRVAVLSGAFALTATACAGPTAASGLPVASRPTDPQPALPAAAAAPAPQSPAPDAAETLLAAVDELCAQERWDEALAKLTRDGDVLGPMPELALRAEMLRDCGRRHDALATWQRLVDLYGLDVLASAVVHDLATLQRLEGRRDEAAATMQLLLARQGQDVYVDQRAQDLRQMLAAIRSGQPITHLSGRDLLGNLRGAPDPEERLRALRLLLAAADRSGGAGANVADRALLVALGDSHGAVRALAVSAWMGAADELPEFCAVAFADPFAGVRMAAIQPARRLPDGAARAMLFAALDKEADPVVFTALHDALCKLLGVEDPLLGIVAAEEEGRRSTVARWRERTEQAR